MITLEGWVDIMYYVMDAHSFYNFIYFILLIIVSAGAEWDARGEGWGGAPALRQPCLGSQAPPLLAGVVLSPGSSEILLVPLVQRRLGLCWPSWVPALD